MGQSNTDREGAGQEGNAVGSAEHPVRGDGWTQRKIRAGRMAGVCFGAVNAHAVDGTWLPAPATSDWNTGTNWTSGAVPDGTATFNTSSQTSITFSSSIFIQRIQFTSTASTFSFALPSTGLGITGAGRSEERR